MDTAVNRSAFLLLLFITGVHLDKDVGLRIGFEGGNITVSPDWNEQWAEVDHYLLYKIYENEDLLLVNCSHPDRPQPDSYNIQCSWDRHSMEYTLKFRNVTMTQNVDYRVEGWTTENITTHASFHLTVCVNRGNVSLYGFKRIVKTLSYEDPLYDDDDVLPRTNFALGNGTSLRVYRTDTLFRDTLVLDTNSSLEPLDEDLKGRLRVELNNSHWLVTAPKMQSNFLFACTIWRGAQCHNYKHIRTRYVLKQVFTDNDKNLSLPCILNGTFHVPIHWDTPTGDIWMSNNQTHKQKAMYMLNGSQTGNYSLIIPSISQNHSGVYKCKMKNTILDHLDLFVCNKSSPLVVRFSHGESVVMANVYYSPKDFVHLYRQKDLHPQILILHADDESVRMPEDLLGRVTLNKFNYSLTISNLTAENSGVYTLRTYGPMDKLCHEERIRLLYKDPFGVDSPFYSVYAPLVGCVLLGLVAAVIGFSLRKRRGEQASGHQSREEHQSGDEDLDDDVEEAEDSV
ncbi:hypothetical protein ACEWY4_017788 [Coilia grayii]|uniref:Ig-like domain-containing protein n=1 Tax=Coilia grayii TaxID=363190 RepID=A0ABD1JI12_9TELE